MAEESSRIRIDILDVHSALLVVCSEQRNSSSMQMGMVPQARDHARGRLESLD